MPIRWPYRCDPQRTEALGDGDEHRAGLGSRPPAEPKKITAQEIVCVVAFSSPTLNSCALTTSTIPETRYVPEIILRRPMVSNRRPMVSGPSRFPGGEGHEVVGGVGGLDVDEETTGDHQRPVSPERPG